MGFTGFYWVFLRFHRVSMGFTGFQWVEMGFLVFFSRFRQGKPVLKGFQLVFFLPEEAGAAASRRRTRT